MKSVDLIVSMCVSSDCDGVVGAGVSVGVVLPFNLLPFNLLEAAAVAWLATAAHAVLCATERGCWIVSLPVFYN